MDKAQASVDETPAATPNDAWPEPQLLPEELRPVKPFDMAVLPSTLRPWVADICERVQCPPDYVAVSVVASLAAVVGRKVAIRPQARTDWTVIANQWALLIGRPGLLKSPAMEQALAMLKRRVARALEENERAVFDFQAQALAEKLRAEAREKQARKLLANNPHADVAHLLSHQEPEEPTLRRYLANDSTAAALGELLRQNPNGLLVHRDELVSLLRALDREDNAEARGFYLTAWNGDSGYTFDRIGRGFNLHIPAVCLSLLGSTQPARLAGYVRAATSGGEADDGLIQRFGLLVWPDTPHEWRNVDQWPNSEARNTAFTVFDYLDTLDAAALGAQQDTDPTGNPDSIPYLRYAPEALEAFTDWRTRLEQRLRSGELSPAMESHLAKYRKLIPSLSLLLNLADRQTGPVGLKPTLQALAWAEYLETHACRVYGSGQQAEVPAAKAILAKLRSGALSQSFSSRDVWRPGWANLADREQVHKALALLVELDWLSSRQEETSGRPRVIYEANPRGIVS